MPFITPRRDERIEDLNRLKTLKELREMIIEYIDSNPGCKTSHIISHVANQKASFDLKTILSVLYELKEKGYVKNTEDLESERPENSERSEMSGRSENQQNTKVESGFGPDWDAIANEYAQLRINRKITEAIADAKRKSSQRSSAHKLMIEFRNRYRDEFENEFVNKFGINSRKNIAEFLEKNPSIFDGILGGILIEYLLENPAIMREIFTRFLDRISGKK